MTTPKLARLAAPHTVRANRLRVLRAGLHTGYKLSQLETARRSGIDQWRYWRIENGHADPTTAEQRALARTLKATIAEAFPDVAGKPGPARGDPDGAAHV